MNAASRVVPVASYRSFLCVRSGHLQKLMIEEWSRGAGQGCPWGGPKEELGSGCGPERGLEGDVLRFDSFV